MPLVSAQLTCLNQDCSNMPTSLALLSDRRLIRMAGADARKLLNGLVTNDLAKLDHTRAVHTGLLSPQGKILFEFFVIDAGGGVLLLDVAGTAGEALVKRLTMYKLRAAVTIEAMSGEGIGDLAVGVAWGDPVKVD
jgi:tRNA-modifying protein YgfZ